MLCIKCGKNIVSEEDARMYAIAELGQDHDCYVFEFAEIHLNQFLNSSDQFEERYTCAKIDACNLKVYQKDGSNQMIVARLSEQIIWFVTHIDNDRTFEEIAKSLVSNFQKCLQGKRLQRRGHKEERNDTTREQFLDEILHDQCK